MHNHICYLDTGIQILSMKIWLFCCYSKFNLNMIIKWVLYTRTQIYEMKLKVIIFTTI